MRKFLTLALVGLFLGLGVANAAEVANTSNVAKVASLNEADMAFLFGENATSVNVIALSQEEMETTKGDGFLTSFLFYTGALTAYNTYNWIKCRTGGNSGCSWKLEGGFEF